MLTRLLLAAALLLPAPALAQEAPPELPLLMQPTVTPKKCPRAFDVLFRTTKGDFIVQVNRKWAPQGAARFHHLVSVGFYDGAYFFRAIDGFMVQFGLNGDPQVDAVWSEHAIPDDPVVESNRRGYVTFAMAGPDSRTTQIFINLVNKNYRLDESGFAPFGKVIQGMDVVDKLYTGYGEGAPMGRGPGQDQIKQRGNAWLEKHYPELDKIESARILK